MRATRGLKTLLWKGHPDCLCKEFANTFYLTFQFQISMSSDCQQALSPYLALFFHSFLILCLLLMAMNLGLEGFFFFSPESPFERWSPERRGDLPTAPETIHTQAKTTPHPPPRPLRVLSSRCWLALTCLIQTTEDKCPLEYFYTAGHFGLIGRFAKP